MAKMKIASDNVKMNVDDGILTIKVNLKKDFGESKSGKTIIVASTLGNKKIEGTEMTMGLNIYKYAE